MTEEERKYVRKNPYAGLEARPPQVNTNDWKNRHRISAKLTPVNYADFFRYCKKNDWSWSAGVNHLIATHPLVNKEFQNHA